MSDKTTPVFIDGPGGSRIQIGVAGEVDPKTLARAVDIWPEFKDRNISEYSIGSDEVISEVETVEEETPKTRGEYRNSKNRGKQS